MVSSAKYSLSLVAAYAPPSVQEKLNEFASRLGLQDAAKGFCNIASKCYTVNPQNEIFYIARGEFLPSRSDFLFVPKATKVSISGSNLTEGQHPETTYYKKFGLSSLWASERSGWFTSLRFARCEKT